MTRPTKQQVAEQWAAIDAQHAEWERLAKENDARIEAELNAKYPASDGWVGTGTQIRMRLRDDPEVIEFYGDGI